MLWLKQESFYPFYGKFNPLPIKRIISRATIREGRDLQKQYLIVSNNTEVYILTTRRVVFYLVKKGVPPRIGDPGVDLGISNIPVS